MSKIIAKKKSLHVFGFFRRINSLLLFIAGFQSLAEGCKWLQIVYLWRCTNITDDAIITLARHCQHIRELNIGSCGNITDASLRAIGECCSHLKCLDFSRTNVGGLCV
jgi:hypothetical protein